VKREGGVQAKKIQERSFGVSSKKGEFTGDIRGSGEKGWIIS